MNLKPLNIGELSQALAGCNAQRVKLASCDLGALNRLLEYTPEDMTVTVEAGMLLPELQEAVARGRQWLPIDPPHPEGLTIADLLASNPSGPHRFGYGTIADYLIGMRVVLADGRVIQSGGKVVKNVAGYDLAKLFIGSRGSLGVVVEATFKLRPIPEMTAFVEHRCDTFDAADALIESVLNSEVTPTIFDLHNCGVSAPTLCSVVLGFAGMQDEVQWQLAEARTLGFTADSSLEYEKQFWREEDTVQRLSVLPSKTISTVTKLNGSRFVARAGNGIIYYRGDALPVAVEPPLKLAQRLKNEFDPNHILPAIPL